MKITYGQGIVSGSYNTGEDAETDVKEHTNGFSVEAQISGMYGKDPCSLLIQKSNPDMCKRHWGSQKFLLGGGYKT